MKKTELAKRIIAILLLSALTFGMTGCGSSSDDDTCAWCNGTGYNGNGAKNATEYVLKKTPCKHCNGTGHF